MGMTQRLFKFISMLATLIFNTNKFSNL
jgi:hypothetical protein